MKLKENKKNKKTISEQTHQKIQHNQRNATLKSKLNTISSKIKSKLTKTKEREREREREREPNLEGDDDDGWERSF